MVQQIAQIRSIGATDTLSNTLTSLSQNQELVTASGLIGQSVTGLADDSTEVKGKVDRVTVKVDGRIIAGMSKFTLATRRWISRIFGLLCLAKLAKRQAASCRQGCCNGLGFVTHDGSYWT